MNAVADYEAALELYGPEDNGTIFLQKTQSRMYWEYSAAYDGWLSLSQCSSVNAVIGKCMVLIDANDWGKYFNCRLHRMFQKTYSTSEIQESVEIGEQ